MKMKNKYSARWDTFLKPPFLIITAGGRRTATSVKIFYPLVSPCVISCTAKPVFSACLPA